MAKQTGKDFLVRPAQALGYLRSGEKAAPSRPHTLAVRSVIDGWGHHASHASCDTACKACTADDSLSSAATVELECAGTDIADPEIAESLCQSPVSLDYDGPSGLESFSQHCDKATNPSPNPCHEGGVPSDLSDDDLPDPPQDSWQPL